MASVEYERQLSWQIKGAIGTFEAWQIKGAIGNQLAKNFIFFIIAILCHHNLLFLTRV
jgi:hypothetical protein